LADIVNLRQHRKQKARAEKERTAEQNRAMHGRSKAEKERDRLATEQAVRFIDGHRRERPKEKTPPGDGDR
jgi:Domain of unknown function (DUF4169)